MSEEGMSGQESMSWNAHDRSRRLNMTIVAQCNTDDGDDKDEHEDDWTTGAMVAQRCTQVHRHGRRD